MDLIVASLNVVGRNLQEIINISYEQFEFDLIALKNPHGTEYPVIGIYTKDKTEFEKVPDFDQLNELVNQWIEKVGIDTIQRESKEIESITWEQLKLMSVYPQH
jgi:hypothetical protein